MRGVPQRVGGRGEDASPPAVRPLLPHGVHRHVVPLPLHLSPLPHRRGGPAPPPPPIQVLLPIPAPTDDSGALFREDDASESSSVSRDLRIEVPARETEGDLRLGLKSPGSWMLSLTSLLSRDSMVCCGRETATELERDPERGEGAATGPPPRRPSSA
ncbi:unnamed protein product [Musa textilis]